MEAASENDTLEDSLNTLWSDTHTQEICVFVFHKHVSAVRSVVYICWMRNFCLLDNVHIVILFPWPDYLHILPM